MISVLNWKEYDKGSLRGFFDLRYHGLTVKSCKLMSGNDGLWFSFPQTKGQEAGEVKYYDQMFLSSLEREHVRKLVLLDLQAQGHIEGSKASTSPKQPAISKPANDMSEGIQAHLPSGAGDDGIPF